MVDVDFASLNGHIFRVFVRSDYLPEFRAKVEEGQAELKQVYVLGDASVIPDAEK